MSSCNPQLPLMIIKLLHNVINQKGNQYVEYRFIARFKWQLATYPTSTKKPYFDPALILPNLAHVSFLSCTAHPKRNTANLNLNQLTYWSIDACCLTRSRPNSAKVSFIVFSFLHSLFLFRWLTFSKNFQDILFILENEMRLLKY